MERQDLNGYRTPEEVVRRWDLSKIELNTEDIEEIKKAIVCDDHLSTTSTAPVQNKVVTAAINNKVTKIPGKGLSTNDFTDEDKASIHTHSNKTALDTITTEKINQWDSNTFSIDLVYPVGSIYMNINSTNPSTLFSNTTWELFGAGRTLVCVDTNDTDFNTSGKTGGSKELQAHSHTYEMRNCAQLSGDGSAQDAPFYSKGTNWGSTNNFPTSQTGTGNSGNLQPYITVYIWKRTA